MAIYIIVFIIIAFSAGLESRSISKHSDTFYISNTRKIINWMVLIVLILVSGTRLIGGSDFYWYENAYNTTPSLYELISNPDVALNVSWTSTLDYGYLIICSVIKSFGLSFHGFCLLQSTFFYTAMYSGLRRYCNNFSMVLLVFLAKLFFYDTFISMRQSITIAFFFLALPLIEKRQLVKYMLVCLICFFIHAGSIVMVVAYLLTYFNVSKRSFCIWIIIFTPFAILGIFNINILGQLEPIISKLLSFASSLWAMKARGYLIDYSSSLSVLYFLEYMTIAVLLFFNFNKVKKMDERADFFIKVFMALWPLLSLFSSTEIITREKDYFILSYGVLLCYFSHMSERRYRQLVLVGTIVICGYEFFRFIHNFESGGMVPYLSWLFN